jgi:hypothetical protein
MPSKRRFDSANLASFGRVREVRIETTSSDRDRTHRTIVWIVTVDDDVFVRSVNGPSAGWYREAIAHPDVVVHADGSAVPARAVPANDANSIERVSDAFRSKYGKRSPGSTEMMIQPHNLESTLRLDPRNPEP